ncbi:toll-like receptor 2 type-2 [Ostrea edulis]|uniref:toll-like receptor 2 type-2 n=1 Tax=Ostrea edulis TaxID=37623 RepID=UPI0024AFCE2F|nr:toll-like receptor 2 type-2 [Ostrea edulis]
MLICCSYQTYFIFRKDCNKHWITKMKWDNCYFVLMLQMSTLATTKERHCRVTQQKNECGNQDWLWNCTRLNYQRIPPDFNTMLKGRTISIDLSRNNFTLISSETFASIKTSILRNITALYFKDNKLQFIDEFSFRRLPMLCVLDLSCCSLKTYTLRTRAFSSLGNLKILYIHGNQFYSNYSYPESELSRLWSLQELHIDVFEGFGFGNNFKRLKKLSTLKFYTTGSIFHLYNNTFSGLSESPIYNLTMDFHHKVRCDVSKYIMCSFPFLRRIAMCFGGLCDLNTVLKTLKCLQNGSIEEISATSNIPVLIRQPLFLNKKNCDYLLSICVRNIDLRKNRIMGISVNPLETNFGKCIEYLDISSNRITSLDPSVVIDILRNYPNLYHIDFSRNKFRDISNIIKNSSLVQLSSKPYIKFTFSKVLKVVRFSHNYLPDIPDGDQFQLKIVGKALKELDLSNSNIPFSRIVEIDFPLLEILNISYNKCTNISILKTSTKLKILRASNMKVNFIADARVVTLFDGLKNLELLDIENNSIHNLPPTLFKEQTMLKYLYLNKNHLSSIPAAVAHLRNLTYLYIQKNKIKSLKTSDFHVLQSLKYAKIFIKGNILDCDCSHISMLRWMKNNSNLFGDLNKTDCIEQSSKLSELLQVRQFVVFEMKCQTGVWLITSSLMLFFVTIGMVVAIAIKRYRVHVDYVILRLRNRLKGVINSEGSNTFKFDAFISYSEDDYELVSTTMYEELTNLGFQISFPEKDFIPGVWKAEQLVQCINESRNVVFVVTENFLDSGWNSYAVQMAVTHAFHNLRKRSIIVVIKDNIPIQRMPKTLRYIWWCIFSIRWPENEDVQAMNSFWKNISAALR